jgi:NADH/NAD ratio-sensing transcriptional regulator Rex
MLEYTRKLYYRNKDLISEKDFDDGVERYLYSCLMANGDYNENLNVSDKVISKLRGSKEIIVYGAGKFAVEVVRFLDAEKINVSALAVTKISTSTYSINELPIYDIDEIERYHKESTIVIGIKREEDRYKIIKELSRRGFQDIVDFSTSFK